MKKFLALFLALLLSLCAVSYAEEEAVEKRSVAEDFEKVQMPDIPEAVKDETDRSAAVCDKVVISGNKYTVTTPEGLVISFTVPNSNVYCLTQDFVAQYDLYSACYDLPVSVAADFIERGMHLNVFDISSQVDIYLYVALADWSLAYPNTAQLTDSQATMVLDYLTQYSIDGVVDSTYGVVGGNVYFYASCGDCVYLVTSINGYQVVLCYATPNQSTAAAGLELLQNLSISTL